MRGCLHVVDQEEPKMLHGMLACDEADERAATKGETKGPCLEENPEIC